MFCAHCGAVMSDGSNFCPKCGAPASQSSFVNSSSQVTPTQPSGFVQPPAAATIYLMQYVTGKGVHVLRDRSITDDNGNVLFTIHRKSNWHMDYDILDSKGELKGSFNIKATGPHHTTEVHDSSGTITAYIKKKLVTIGAPKWWIEDSQNQKTADVNGQFASTEYKVVSNQGETLAWVNRDFSSFSNLSHGTCVIHLANEGFDKILLFALCTDAESVR